MTGTAGDRNDAPADRSSLADGDVVEVVRSEERLRVGRAVRVSGRAVLRRYVVTEAVTKTFQVRHEEVRLDHEPVGENEACAPSSTAFQDRGVEMVLRREEPVVQMRLVPTVRVRLHVNTVTEQVRVSDEVDHERIDVELLDSSTGRD